MGAPQLEVQGVREQQDEGSTQTINDGAKLRLQSSRRMRHREAAELEQHRETRVAQQYLLGHQMVYCDEVEHENEPRQRGHVESADERLGQTLRLVGCALHLFRASMYRGKSNNTTPFFSTWSVADP